MSAPTHRYEPGPAPTEVDSTANDHAGHSGWLMLLCCVPMIIAVVLIIVGG